MQQRVLLAVAIAVVATGSPGLALQREGGRLPPCPAGAERTPRDSKAQHCWFKSARGGWRILSHDAHYDSVVYHISADSLDDAAAIATAIVGGEGSNLRELMVYVYSEPLGSSVRIRRVRWDRVRGYQTLDFRGRPPDWIIREDSTVVRGVSSPGSARRV